MTDDGGLPVRRGAETLGNQEQRIEEVTDPGLSGPRRASVTMTRSEVRLSYGVLTDPKSLAEYEQVVPGYGAKILDTYLRQVDEERVHRHSVELRLLESTQADTLHAQRLRSRGQWMGLAVALAGFVLVGFLALIHQPWLAGVVAALDILSLVSAFIYGRKKQSEETLAENESSDSSEPETTAITASSPAPRE